MASSMTKDETEVRHLPQKRKQQALVAEDFCVIPPFQGNDTNQSEKIEAQQQQKTPPLQHLENEASVLELIETSEESLPYQKNNKQNDIGSMNELDTEVAENNSSSGSQESWQAESGVLDSTSAALDTNDRAHVSSGAGDDNDDYQSYDEYFCHRSGNVNYDASIFVRSPISATELKAVAGRIKSALKEPLEVVEREGYCVNKSRIDQIKVHKQNKHDEIVQQAIADSLIRGNPREYQTALLEIAKKKNIIINLGTGCGKTLIAVLLIKHFAESIEQEKQVLFMVPSVALAVQHTSTLRANLNFSVETACSSSNWSEESRRKLAKCNVLVATHGAIHDLLMHYGDLFRMDRFCLLVVDECHYAYGRHPYCLVMNEFYHNIQPESRPRVLGLTASPLVNVKTGHTDEHLNLTLGKLESTLDATVTSVFGLGLEEIERFNLMMKSADEKDVIFEKQTQTCVIPAFEDIGLHEGRIKEFKRLEVLFQELGPKVLSVYCRTVAREVSCNSFEKETPFQHELAVNHLETIARFADEMCELCPFGGRNDKLLALEELLEQEIEGGTGANTVGLVFVERRITALALSDYFRYRTEQVNAGVWIRAHSIRNGSSVVKPSARKRHWNDDDKTEESSDDCGQFDDAIEHETPKCGDVDVTSYCAHGGDDGVSGLEDQFGDAYEPLIGCVPDDVRTAKLGTVSEAPDRPEKVLEELRNHECDSFCGGGSVAMADSIRCGVLVRSSTNIFKSLNAAMNMSRIEQAEAHRNWLHQETKIRETLNKLRRRDINVLIATSVVEEGVDVQACSFVAVFDAIKSTKAYIQMKGRARQEHAKFFVFQPRNHYGKGVISLCVAQEMEQRVHRFLATRVSVLQPPVQKMNYYCGESFDWEMQALAGGGFTTEFGRVDLNTAKSLVNRYALSLPMDPFARIYKDSLLAHLPVYEDYLLSLPSHLPRAVRVVALPETYRNNTRKQRENLLALMACARLYRNGLLNARLLPLTREDMKDRVMLVATQMPEEIPVRTAEPTEPSEAFIYIIEHKNPVFNRNDSILNGQGRRLAIVTSTPSLTDFPKLRFRHCQFGRVSIEIVQAGKVNLNEDMRQILGDFFLLLLNTRWRRKTQPFYFRARQDGAAVVVPKYFVGLVSAKNVLDWGYMSQLLKESRRTRDERIDAVRSLPESEPLASPRLWSPIYDPNNTYVAYGPTGDTCSSFFPFQKERKVEIKTYREYFKVVRGFDVKPTCALFEVQRCWLLPVVSKKFSKAEAEPSVLKKLKPNHRSAGHKVCPELPIAELPKYACFEPPLADPYVYLCCALLPQVMYLTERHITAKEFVNHCIPSLPIFGRCLEMLPVEKVEEALSSKSCSLDVSFDKLEWLGDAVLKLAQTHSLLHSVDLNRWIPFLHEGDLSSLRSAMGCNDRLEKACNVLHFKEFVLTAPLARGRWIPAHIEKFLPEKNEDKGTTYDNPKSGKVYADVMESLLGLIFVHFGYDTTLEVAGELCLTIPWSISSDSDCKVSPKPSLLSAAARCTGHTCFSRPELVEEAFTHSTALFPEVPSYQRLEWAGDAVLCLTVRDRIYKQFSDMLLGEMVVLEAALVANETLAYISLKNGLPKLINHRDQSLPGRIESYDWSVKELGRGLWGTDPPKVISDVVESLIGAVYIDAGYISGRNAVARLLEPIFQYLARPRESFDDIPVKHPKKVMQEIAGNLLSIASSTERDLAASRKDICDESAMVWHDNCWRKLDPKGQQYVAEIQFVGRDLLLVADASPVVAKSRACAFVVSMLEQETGLLQRLRRVNSLADRANMMQKKLDNEKDEDSTDEDSMEVVPVFQSGTKNVYGSNCGRVYRKHL